MSYYRTRGMASLGAATFEGKDYYVRLTPYVLGHGDHSVAWNKAHDRAYPDDGVTKVVKWGTAPCTAKLYKKQPECGIEQFQNKQPRAPIIKGPYATLAEAKQKAADANKGVGVLDKGRGVYVAFAAEVFAKPKTGVGVGARTGTTTPVSVLARASALLKPPAPLAPQAPVPGYEAPPGGGGGESPPAGGGGPAAASPGGGQVVETDNVAVTERGPVPATPDGRPAAAAITSPVPTRTVLLIGGGLAVAYLMFGRKRA